MSTPLQMQIIKVPTTTRDRIPQDAVDAIGLVEDLNNDLDESVESCGFSVETNGLVTSVLFFDAETGLDCCLYHSENDSLWDKDDNKVSLRDFVVRRLLGLIDRLASVRSAVARTPAKTESES